METNNELNTLLEKVDTVSEVEFNTTLDTMSGGSMLTSYFVTKLRKIDLSDDRAILKGYLVAMRDALEYEGGFLQ